MSEKITYDDKVSLTTSSLPRANKCTADDLNEIKEVVNANATQLDTVVPLASIEMYAGSTAPDNWLFCRGQAISRAEYSDLFNVIGTAYGPGDGSTTFNLPNIEGKFPVGYKGADDDFETLGNSGGEKEHELTIDEMPSHNHGITSNSVGGSSTMYVSIGSEYSVPNPTGNIVVGNTGGGQAHNNLPPYIVLNFIIKVKEG